MKEPYRLTRSKRRSVSLSVAPDLTVQVKAPLRTPLAFIEEFVEKHAGWIARQREIVARRVQHSLTPGQIEQLRARAKEELPQRAAYYGAVMGVTPAGVKITSAATRWGSCSGKNSICFSYRLMLLPPELRDYIVVHELAHIRVKDHSQRFYQEVERWLPDYRERVTELKRIEKELPR